MPVQASSIDVDTTYTKADSSSWNFSGFGRATWISQSFTPGVTGTLDRIDLQIFRRASDDLRFRFGSGEAIAGNYVELVTFDVLAANVPTTEGGLFSVDLSSYGLKLQAGSLYSVILSSTQTGSFGQFGWTIGEITSGGVEISAPPYAGGRAFASTDQGATWGTRGVDRPLRTWMTAAVPEPASWALMITGFGLAGMAMRRRRAAAA
jgi:hypothetical protein